MSGEIDSSIPKQIVLNGKVSNGKNGLPKTDDNDNKNDIIPTIVEVPPDDVPKRKLKRADSKREKRISFRGERSTISFSEEPFVFSIHFFRVHIITLFWEIQVSKFVTRQIST